MHYMLYKQLSADDWDPVPFVEAVHVHDVPD